MVNATPPEHERQQNWQLERQRILAARAKVEREAAEAGTPLVHALPEPPTSPPDWYENDDRTTHVEHSRPAPADPRVIQLPGGVLGRPPPPKPEPSPEDVFRAAARRDKVKRLTGLTLPT